MRVIGRAGKRPEITVSVKGVSVGIEDLQVYCIYYKQNILQYLHELFETGIIIYYPGVFLWFSFHPIQLPGSLHAILCPLIPVVPLVGGLGISLLSYQTIKSKVN